MVPTATTTPTPAAVPAAQELKPYPNPVNPLVQDLLIAVNVESLSAEISFKAYTTALRLVRHIKLGTMSQGVKVCTIARDALKDLSNGVYFCVIEQQGNDKKTSRSKTVKIIILK